MAANNWSLVLAVILILIFISLQIISFIRTRKNILRLKNLFADDIENNLQVREYEIPIELLKDSRRLQTCLEQNNSFGSIEEGVEYEKISLIYIKSSGNISNELKDIIVNTNKYLCKNIGTTADFSVIKDICNNAIQTKENEIQNTLNVPLYFGLAGTFSGIICGLLGMEVAQIFEDTKQLQHLLYGVIGAMSASLIGLLLTIYNSAKEYKTASINNSKNQENYFDFLRQELMPVLSNTMSQSLNSLKGVLGHFVDNFGRNLDSYADSAELLNDNLEKQHLVLQELNHLSLTRTSMRIAETFKTLDDSAKSLEVFKNYQDQLNSTIANLNTTTTKVDSIISAFSDFANELRILSSNQNVTVKLQQEFSEAIQTHFPTGSEGRDIWRKEFDALIEDAQKATEQLSTELTNSSNYIVNFVNNNAEFFDSFAKLNSVIDTLVQYTNLQAQSYSQLTQQISDLRKDYKEAQQESVELSKTTIEAIREMTKQLKDNKK